MDSLFRVLSKLHTTKIAFTLISHPHFSVEVVLAIILCIIQILLIFDVNQVYVTTKGKYAEKEKLKLSNQRNLQNKSSLKRTSNQKIITTTRKNSSLPRCLFFDRQLNEKPRLVSVIPNSDPLYYANPNLSRAERLLAVSPSEYVRLYKEHRERQSIIKSDLDSLTFVLKKAKTHNSYYGSSTETSVTTSIISIETVETISNINTSYVDDSSVNTIITSYVKKRCLRKCMNTIDLTKPPYSEIDVELFRRKVFGEN